MEVQMVTDGRVKELRRLLQMGRTLADSARMAEMSEKTARKYRDGDQLPSQKKSERNYRTRVDPFADVWDEVRERLELEPRLKAKTLFEWLQQKYPVQFADSTRRTFERRVAKWRSLHGPGKTVFFGQDHHPGRLAASDFTVCNELGVKIAGQRFEHTFFHCVLTFSNVESVSLCFSESFEALSAGIQKAFWEFGGVPLRHRSDSLAAAVRNHTSRRELTERYAALMDYYGCQAERTNARCANENGDVESSNGHLKTRIDQALMLRGSRDFPSRDEYVAFVEELVKRANANRRKKFLEDVAHLNRLPNQRLDTDDIVKGVRVSRSSTINVRTNTYSVPSRLIGSKVDLRIAAESITVMHQGHVIQTMPRLVGKKLAAINYRHIIDSLVRKTGAFANYQYREEMFPTSAFRMAWDALRAAHSKKMADKMYVQILHLAAHESQDAVADALRHLLATEHKFDVDHVRQLVTDATSIPAPTDINVEAPDLCEFDSLLSTFDKECPNHDQSREETNCEKRHEGSDEKHRQNDTSNHADSEGTSDTGSGPTTDQPVEGTPPADGSRSLPEGGCQRGDGEPQPPGVPGGTHNSGMRSQTRRPHQTSDETFETPGGQDMEQLQVQTLTADGDASTGNAAGRFVSGSSRECSSVRQTRLGKKPRLVCALGAVNSAGPQHSVHDVQSAGSATVDCETRPASAEDDQTTLELRGSDHRRSGLRPAEPRGNGDPVYPSSRTLRTRQRDADQQPGLQQVGSDFQGRDDNRSSHRPPGPPQRHHRTQCPQLPSRNGKNQNEQLTELPNQNREF